MNGKLIIVISVALMFVAVSCKKKEKEASSAPEINYNVTDAYSMLQTTHHTSDNLGVLWKDSSALAVFFDKPMKNSGSSYISAGTVKLNDSVLYYNSGVYSSYQLINITAPVKWSVSGTGTITPFDFTITPSYPKYTGGNILPDTCIKANGMTITVSGVSNTNQGVSLFLNSSSVNLSKYISGNGNGSVIFTTTDLATFNVNSNIYLQLMMSNYNTQSINGVVHSFVSTTSYQKIIWLK